MKPWYRQFWPWFVIALPSIAVIASVVTLVIALDHPDPLVRDDWYRRGQRINDELVLDAAAASSNISAVLSVGRDGSVALQLDAPEGARPALLEMELHHPTEAARDLHLQLRGDGRGRFEGRIRGGSEGRPGAEVPVVLDGNWDVSLQPVIADWRLEARVFLPSAAVRLRAGS